MELAVAPGYDDEGERFGAIDADRGFFRVKPYTQAGLWQVLRHIRSHSFTDSAW
jgi:hypothetical protein